VAVENVLTSLQKIIKEEMSFVKRETEPEVDGIFDAVLTTSAGVGKDELGRDYKVIHTFFTGLAGGVKDVSALGPSVLDPIGQAYGFKALSNAGWRTWPAVTDQSGPGYVQQTIQLVQAMGNMTIPLHMLAAERLDAAIAKPAALIMKGTAKHWAQTEANKLYSNEPNMKAIITALGASGAAATHTFTVGTTGGTTNLGRIARLMPGMQVDVYDTPGVTRRNESGGVRIPVVVSKVDYISRAFTIASVDGSTTFAVTAADVLVVANPTVASGVAVGPSPIEYWLTNSGTIFGISLTTHPQFKSLVAAESVLDETTLNKYIAGFFDSYGGMYDLDSIIGTAGTMTAYMDDVIPDSRYERNGKELSVKHGWSSFKYNLEGRDFRYLASRYQKPGQVYILKLSDGNFKRYVPPDIPGTKGQAGFPGDVQFVGPKLGYNGIFTPVINGDGAHVEAVQAPFTVFREYCPEQLPGIKLTGLSEINGV